MPTFSLRALCAICVALLPCVVAHAEPLQKLDVYPTTIELNGPRNEQRMPDYLRFDLGLEHRFHIGKLQPWIGIRAYNAFNAFLPADVQANISSPAFGSFYNSQFRQYRLQVRFER